MVSTPGRALGETLVAAEAIQQRIIELARQIDAAYPNTARPLVLVCVLKGSLIFTADLARALRVPVELDCVAVRSYSGSTVTTGQVEMVKDIGMSLRDRDVLIVEDIVDTGRTIAFLREHLEHHGPRSLRLVTLLDKVSRRVRQVSVDWAGFQIPDRFVVGYGLDHVEQHRNLPDVHVLGEE